MNKFAALSGAMLCFAIPVNAQVQDGFRQPDIVRPYDTCRQDAEAIAIQGNEAQEAAKTTYGRGLTGFGVGLNKACRIVHEGTIVMNRANCQSDSNYAEIMRLFDGYKRQATEYKQAGGAVDVSFCR